MAFREDILAVVRAIPAGTALSYKDVAARAGYPRAFRAVGALMKKNYDPSVPCHRVIRADGRAGEYNRGVEKKIALLVSEGYVFFSRAR